MLAVTWGPQFLSSGLNWASLAWCLGCWEGEPGMDWVLFNKVWPHFIMIHIALLVLHWLRQSQPHPDSWGRNMNSPWSVSPGTRWARERGTHLWKMQPFVLCQSSPFASYGWPYSVNAAAAAKSLQLCLTLCDPIDGSPPGSAAPGIL